jgi:hypothetical protein
MSMLLLTFFWILDLEFGILWNFFFLLRHGIGLQIREWFWEWLVVMTKKVMGSDGIGLWARTGFCA